MELRLEGVCKTHRGGVTALRGVSLTAPRGMFGLLGPNGAGKTTLMRSIATLLEVDAGTLTLGDIDIRREPERLRAVLGYLPQAFGVYPEASALDLLDQLARLKGLSGRGERREAVAALLEKTGLWELRHRRLGGFSGGMKQRFGIAQALLGSPRLLIVDEPTAGLDPAERMRFHDLLAELGNDIVVLLSTHIVADVADLCPRMAILAQGQVVLQGRPQELLERLRGRVWKVLGPPGEGVPDGLRVLAVRRLAGQRLFHVYSESCPGRGYQATDPDLEDLYLEAVPPTRERAA